MRLCATQKIPTAKKENINVSILGSITFNCYISWHYHQSYHQAAVCLKQAG